MLQNVRTFNHGLCCKLSKMKSKLNSVVMQLFSITPQYLVTEVSGLVLLVSSII